MESQKHGSPGTGIILKCDFKKIEEVAREFINGDMPGENQITFKMDMEEEGYWFCSSTRAKVLQNQTITEDSRLLYVMKVDAKNSFSFPKGHPREGETLESTHEFFFDLTKVLSGRQKELLEIIKKIERMPENLPDMPELSRPEWMDGQRG